MKLNRYSPILVSVLIPTRGRRAVLNDAVRSLISNADNPAQVEIIIRFEEDDPELPGMKMDIQSMCADSPLQMIQGPRGNGFADLGTHWNTMAALANGDWLFVFNDDCLMPTKGWDTLLSNMEPDTIQPGWPGNGDICIVKAFTGANGNPFPLITRKLFQFLGRLSHNTPHLDTYLEKIARPLKLEVLFKDITVIHRRKNMKDECHAASQASYPVTGRAFHWPPVKLEMIKDRQKVADLLGVEVPKPQPKQPKPKVTA